MTISETNSPKGISPKTLEGIQLIPKSNNIFPDLLSPEIPEEQNKNIPYAVN